MTHARRTPILALILALLLAALLPSGGALRAQTPALADTGWRRLATGMYGEVAVVIQRRPDGRVEVSAAGEQRRGQAAFTPAALVRWADTTAKLVTRRERPGKQERVLRSAIEEPGVVAGAMALTRRVDAEGSRFTLFFADTSFSGFTVPLEQEEAQVFVGSVRKAAARAAAMSGAEPKAAKKRKQRGAAKAESEPSGR